ncbi:GNAT family N-acetyltransferase [Sphingoaurantiacus capsulatus]|uniref:GNAT family N-acetyltransferase n=1 Tax=Sphingoaurantiacus capsulatus TaxID=1771310 RepID=A0ABV7X695_9SPHN
MSLLAGYRLSDDKAELQLDVIHGFLAQTYWSPGIPRAVVERAIANSRCVGAYAVDGRQLGFARLVTDDATFAYLCDVFVLPEVRGQGVSKAMVGFFLDHPELQNLRRWMLATSDAHGVYARFGFAPPDAEQAGRLMQRLDPDVYQRMAS